MATLTFTQLLILSWEVFKQKLRRILTHDFLGGAGVHQVSDVLLPFLYPVLPLTALPAALSGGLRALVLFLLQI